MIGLLPYHFVHIQSGWKIDQVFSYENVCHTPSLTRHGVMHHGEKIKPYLVPH